MAEEKSAHIVYNTTAENAHGLLSRGDPRTNGPWLDEVRAKEEEEYVARRVAARKAAAKAEKEAAKAEEEAAKPVAKKTAAKK